MGLRATSVTIYKIEYGNHQGFNYDPDTLNNLIMNFVDDFYNGDDGCGGNSTDQIWEIDKQSFADMLQQIKDMPVEEFDELMKGCDVHAGMENRDYDVYTKKYVVNLFQGFLDDTQEDSNYVRIGWL